MNDAKRHFNFSSMPLSPLLVGTLCLLILLDFVFDLYAFYLVSRFLCQDPSRVTALPSGALDVIKRYNSKLRFSPLAFLSNGLFFVARSRQVQGKTLPDSLNVRVTNWN